jgi:ParB/RepB/Spo0J family partition protein
VERVSRRIENTSARGVREKESSAMRTVGKRSVKEKAESTAESTPPQKEKVRNLTLSEIGKIDREQGIEWEETNVDLELLPRSEGPKPSRSLVESVREVGILSPVILIEQGEGFAIVDGHRRIQAARDADLKYLPARVGKITGLMGSALSIVMNEQRSANPVKELEAVTRLSKEGLSESEIAKVTGMPVARIRKRMTLARLKKPLLDKFVAGEIKTRVAEDLARLSPAQQKIAVDREKEGEPITARMVEEIKHVKREQTLGSFADLLSGSIPDQPTNGQRGPADETLVSLRGLAQEIGRGDIDPAAGSLLLIQGIDQLLGRGEYDDVPQS